MIYKVGRKGNQNLVKIYICLQFSSFLPRKRRKIEAEVNDLKFVLFLFP